MKFTKPILAAIASGLGWFFRVALSDVLDLIAFTIVGFVVCHFFGGWICAAYVALVLIIISFALDRRRK